MELSRAIRKSISRVLIGVLLFAQLAVVSYACPSLTRMGANSLPNSGVAPAMLSAAVDATPEMQRNGMPPGCDQIDPDAANLCAEHCRQGQLSVDTSPVPAPAATRRRGSAGRRLRATRRRQVPQPARHG